MKVIIKTKKAPAAVGAYSQGVIVGNLLFISGQLAIDPKCKDGRTITCTIKKETKQVMKNIGAILKAAGCTFEDVVKCSVFVKDIAQAKVINKVYARFFEEATAPAREFVEVSNIPRGCNLEISAIAQVNLVGKNLSNLSR